jgi:C4-dicarboxylate-specific signal transduction histidine kinase
MLILHYREGWSLRRIAKAFGRHHWQVRRDLDAACCAISDDLPADVCATHPLVEALLRYDDSDPQRHSSRDMAQKREQLVDELEASVLRRSADLEQAAECMDADCPAFHKRSKGPDWQQWEMRYLNRTGRTSISSSAYDACRAALYCDADES